MEFNVKLSGEIENEFEVWINVERARDEGGGIVTTWRLALLQVTARWPGSQVQEGGHSPDTAPAPATSSSRAAGGITAPSPAPGPQCPHAGAASSHGTSCFLITALRKCIATNSNF